MLIFSRYFHVLKMKNSTNSISEKQTQQKSEFMFAILLPIITTILICFSLVIQGGHCHGGPQGFFQLRLKRFQNSRQTLANGRCCDGSRGGPSGCLADCATKFRLCLKHYMAQVDVESNCTFGEQITPVVRTTAGGDGNGGDLGRDLQTIQFDIDFKWPVG